METEINFHIILLKPPAGIDYGLQKGKGNAYETLQKQRSAGNDLEFRFNARIKNDKNGEPDFFGPFVQGPVGTRFVYIGIGTHAGQTNTQWSRRLKIPLSGITTEIIKKISGNNRMILETKVPGTGKDGGPNCATVKPFDGWKITNT